MKIQLTSIRKSITHPLSSDIRAIYIKTIKVESLDEGVELDAKIITESLRIRWEFMNADNHMESDTFPMDFPCVNNKEFVVNSLIGDVNTPRKSIRFELVTNISINFQVVFEIETVDLLSIKTPEQTFGLHLKEDFNSKILFSAPFGQGKTTFLKNFFGTYKNGYEVFHLYPVNYSISNNKDVFEYIKCAILLELLKQPKLKFDKEEFSYLITLPDFVKKNGYNLFKPFLKLIPEVGGAIYDIVDNVEELSKEYFKDQNDVQVDDKKTAINYIQRFYEESGSLYEDNFITQLIRQLLEQLKQASGKENILIVDDLDRMDPEHIFRILNVFAAHFDQDASLTLTNKFGFDKVILVCDYNNLHRIFAHKYGKTTDFAGYIDKFFSKGIFYYNNKHSVAQIIDSISINSNLKIVLTDLHELGQLSLRELLKLEDTNLSWFQKEIENESKSEPQFPVLVRLLSSIFDVDTVIRKLEYCMSTRVNRVKRSEYEQLTKDLLAQYFVDKAVSNLSNMSFQFTLNGKKLTFTVDYRRDNNSIHYISKIEDPMNIQNKEFHETLNYYDFYSVLITWIKESPIWKQVGS